MLFSIIVPAYNAAKYLPACVYSVLSQSGADFELLLVNDGSTDDTAAIINACAGACPDRIVAVHTKNQGTILARREGIRRARGEFLLFADADDLLRPDCFATVAQRLAESGADVLIYNFEAFDEGKPPVVEPPVFEDGRVFEGEGKRAVYDVLLDSWKLNNLWFKAIRRELMQEDPTDFAAFADNPIGDDLLASLYPLTAARRIAYCALPLYSYRNTPGSLTRVPDDRYYGRLCDTRVAEQLGRYLPRWGMDTADARRRLLTRQLLSRVDTCMMFFRRAADAKTRRAVLGRDWFVNLPADSAAGRRAARALPLRRRIQYFCIRRRLAGLLALLTRLASRRTR